jgi:4-nitrophenyl phosphatase
LGRQAAKYAPIIPENSGKVYVPRANKESRVPLPNTESFEKRLILKTAHLEEEIRMPGFLIDLDGTLYKGSRPVPHAAEFISSLRKLRLPYLYVTNNSSRTPGQVAGHLARFGIEADPQEIVTTSAAAADYVVRSGKGRKVFLIGEHGLEHALREAGLRLTDEAPDFVVQGIDRQFSYGKLEKAVRMIREGAGFVLTNPDRLLPSDTGLSPGAGSLAAAIEAAAGVEPVIIGKPSAILMRYALERIGMPPEDVWAVGDNLRTDIAGGAAAGLRTALVLTGVTTPGNLAGEIRAAGAVPDLTVPDLRELSRRLL